MTARDESPSVCRLLAGWSTNITRMSTEPFLTPDAHSLSHVMKKPPGPSDLPSRLRVHTQFASRFIGEKHDFVVYVPRAFRDDPKRLFPVLYLQAGKICSTPRLHSSRGTIGGSVKPPRDSSMRARLNLW